MCQRPHWLASQLNDKTGIIEHASAPGLTVARRRTGNVRARLVEAAVSGEAREEARSGAEHSGWASRRPSFPLCSG